MARMHCYRCAGTGVGKDRAGACLDAGEHERPVPVTPTSTEGSPLMGYIADLMAQVRAEGYRGRAALREAARRNEAAVTAREDTARAADEQGGR